MLIISAIIFIGGLFCIRAKQSGEETFNCLFCCKNHQNEDKIDDMEQVDSIPATITTFQQQKTNTTSPKQQNFSNFRIRAVTPNNATNQFRQPVLTPKPKPKRLGPKRKMGQRDKKTQAVEKKLTFVPLKNTLRYVDLSQAGGAFIRRNKSSVKAGPRTVWVQTV